MVATAVLGYGTLAVHQEAVPPPLLGESILVALSDEAVQLALLVADGLHILWTGRERWQNVFRTSYQNSQVIDNNNNNICAN